MINFQNQNALQKMEINAACLLDTMVSGITNARLLELIMTDGGVQRQEMQMELTTNGKIVKEGQDAHRLFDLIFCSSKSQLIS